MAHNAPFDTEFIRADIEKYETIAPTGVILDTCAMARKVIQGSPNYKLVTLVAHLKIPVEGGRSIERKPMPDFAGIYLKSC